MATTPIPVQHEKAIEKIEASFGKKITKAMLAKANAAADAQIEQGVRKSKEAIVVGLLQPLLKAIKQNDEGMLARVASEFGQEGRDAVRETSAAAEAKPKRGKKEPAPKKAKAEKPAAKAKAKKAAAEKSDRWCAQPKCKENAIAGGSFCAEHTTKTTSRSSGAIKNKTTEGLVTRNGLGKVATLDTIENIFRSFSKRQAHVDDVRLSIAKLGLDEEIPEQKFLNAINILRAQKRIANVERNVWQATAAK